MGLVLEEFYTSLNACGVSATTGLGMDSFMESIQKGVQEYNEVFLPDLENRFKINLEQKERLIKENEDKFESDHAKEKAEEKEIDVEALYNESVETLMNSLKM